MGEAKASLSITAHTHPHMQISLVSAQLQNRCSSVGPQDVANVLCAMARMGMRPSAQWMASVMANVSAPFCRGMARRGLIRSYVDV